MDLTRIIDMQLAHISTTPLRKMLVRMIKECLIYSLQNGAIEVSDGMVRQAAQHLIESIVHEMVRALVVAELHTALQHTATTNHPASRFLETSSFFYPVYDMVNTINVPEVQRLLPMHPAYVRKNPETSIPTDVSHFDTLSSVTPTAAPSYKSKAKKLRNHRDRRAKARLPTNEESSDSARS